MNESGIRDGVSNKGRNSLLRLTSCLHDAEGQVWPQAAKSIKNLACGSIVHAGPPAPP